MVPRTDASPPIPASLTDRLLDEGVLSIVAAARAEGLSISAKTALRWALHGTRAVDSPRAPPFEGSLPRSSATPRRRRRRSTCARPTRC